MKLERIFGLADKIAEAQKVLQDEDVRDGMPRTGVEGTLIIATCTECGGDLYWYDDLWSGMRDYDDGCLICDNNKRIVTAAARESFKDEEQA